MDNWGVREESEEAIASGTPIEIVFGTVGGRNRQVAGNLSNLLVDRL
ncbi:hypothetical protein SH467x_003948 [Pirellulaceae bacterium SH467]|jgi:hypothetical protein